MTNSQSPADSIFGMIDRDREHLTGEQPLGPHYPWANSCNCADCSECPCPHRFACSACACPSCRARQAQGRVIPPRDYSGNGPCA